MYEETENGSNWRVDRDGDVELEVGEVEVYLTEGDLRTMLAKIEAQNTKGTER
jgi:hypothetical protein